MKRAITYFILYLMLASMVFGGNKNLPKLICTCDIEHVPADDSSDVSDKTREIEVKAISRSGKETKIYRNIQLQLEE